jgi:hypothetical protein
MNSKICVSMWLKALMYLISLLPGLASFAVLVPHQSWPGENPWLAAIGFGTLLAASCWLFSRMYFLCSIVMTESGLEQSFLSLLRSGFRRNVQLGWDQVADVSFSRFSYHFRGKDGERLELNTSLFNDMQATIRTVRDRLPARLQAQLGH